jgi:hypothetical protein
MKKIAIFLVLIIVIFSLSLTLFPEDTDIFLKRVSRLDLLDPLFGAEDYADHQTVQYTIPASNLEAGEVVGYRSYAQDTSDNWFASEIKYFRVESDSPPSQGFQVTNIECNPVSLGHLCNIDYNNDAGEIKFLLIITDSTGRVIQSSSPLGSLNPGLGTVEGTIICSETSGKYKMSWWAFPASDTILSNPIAWAAPPLVELDCG